MSSGPQHRTPPLADKAQSKFKPTRTSTYLPAGGGGTSSAPQQTKAPSSRTAHACPARLTAVNAPRGGSGDPSSPQHTRRPPSRTAQTRPSPVLTAMNLSPGAGELGGLAPASQAQQASIPSALMTQVSKVPTETA